MAQTANGKYEKEQNTMRKAIAKKLIFFFPKEQVSENVHKIYLQWAQYIANENIRIVYYIHSSKPNMNIINSHYSEKVNYIDWEDTSIDRINLFDHADVLVPINYVQVLLAYMPKKSNCKVALIMGDIGEKTRFKNNFSLGRRADEDGLSEFYQVLKDEQALIYKDMNCYLEQNNKVWEDSYLSYTHVFCQKQKTESDSPGLICNNRINVAWVGAINTIQIHSFINTVNRLHRNKVNSQPIDIHVIGNGNAKWKIDIAKYAPRIRFIHPSVLEGEELTSYLVENVDFVVAMGTAALDASLSQIPVVLPIFSQKELNSNKFIYLHNSKGYTLQPTARFVRMAGVHYQTMEDILIDVYSNKEKQSIGLQCKKFTEKNFSIAHSANCLLAAINCCTLTGNRLAAVNILHDEMVKYEKYKKILPNNSIISYLDFLHQEAAAYSKGKLSHLLFLPKKAVRKGTKKIYNVLQKEKHRVLLRKEYKAVLNHYDEVLLTLKNKLQNTGMLKVGFVVIFSSTFTYRPIFEKMMQSDIFDPYIIVVADVSRSPEFREEQFNRACFELEEKYPKRVIPGFFAETNDHLELNEEYSILFFANPYGKMVAPEYQIRHFWKKNVLLLYAYYGFGATTYGRLVMQTDVYNSVWKLLLDTELSLQDLKIHQPVKGKNGLVTGYVKMDELAQIPVEKRERKRVLICPHHTVMNWDALNLSNFVPYAEGILELPKQYPDIDFVFRPHPMLFDNLRRYKIWTEEQIQSYLTRLEEIPNIVHSTEGDYMELFVNSDAMIHDCSSFIGEYLFTEHPCCYMYKPETKVEDVYTPLGLKCLEQYYPAHAWSDVIDFIDRVVIGQEDPKETQRKAFVKETLKFAYPNSAQNIVDMIRDAISSAN